jgi:methionine synthase II (cobalamin-independent)
MDWNCLPACIGSLPHLRPDQAVDEMLRHMKRIPFWPQMPTMGFEENMYAQYSTHLPGIKIDAHGKRISVDLTDYDPERFYEAVLGEDFNYFEYPRSCFHGLYELLEDHELPKETQALKGQVTGPISMGLQIFDQNGKSVIYDEAYAEIVRKNLNMLMRQQEFMLRQKFPRTIMFMDEPSLSLVGTPFAAVSKENVIKWINEVFEGVQSLKGLHCCGNTDWPMVLSTDIDILSFDAYNYGYTISLFPEEVKNFLYRGGTIAWGIVPNDEEKLRAETPAKLVERLEREMATLSSRGISPNLVMRSSIITPQCGLGPLNDESLVESALHMLVNTSDVMRTRHLLG